MSRDKIEEAGYEKVQKSSGVDVLRELSIGKPSGPADQVNRLFRFKDLQEGGVVEVDGINFEVRVSRLCDFCEDETEILNIADGLRRKIVLAEIEDTIPVKVIGAVTRNTLETVSSENSVEKSGAEG